MRLDADGDPTDRAGSRGGGGERACGAGGAIRRCCCWPRGMPAAAVAHTLRCSRASVYAWAAALAAAGGGAGCAKATTAAAGSSWMRRARRCWRALLATDPQARGHHATGWTVPLLRTELARAGYRGRRADHPPRLAPAGLSLEAAAVRAGTARSGLRRKKGAVIAQAQAMLAAGGEVWVADETALARVPAACAPAGANAGSRRVVLISGRNTRRTILGALQREQRANWCARCASAAAPTTCSPRWRRWGRCGPTVPKLLIWDNAPPHHPHRVRDAAAAAGITLAFLPFRSPGADAAGGAVARAESDRRGQPLLPLPRRAHRSAPSPGSMA